MLSFSRDMPSPRVRWRPIAAAWLLAAPIFPLGASPPPSVPNEPAELARKLFHDTISRPHDGPVLGLFRGALGEAEDTLRAARARDPSSEDDLVRLLSFFDDWIERAAWVDEPSPLQDELRVRARGYAAEMLALLRSEAVPAELWRRLEGKAGFEAKAAILILWLASDPRDPAVLAALGEELADPMLRAALYRAAFAARPEAQTDPLLTAWLLQERLSSLFDLRLPRTALAELSAAPPSARHLLLSGATQAVDLEVAGLPVAAALRDLRLDLVAAFAITGEPRRAAELLEELPEPLSIPEPGPRTGYDPQGEKARAIALDRRLLERLLAETGVRAPGAPLDDPFDLFLDVLGATDFYLPGWSLRDQVAARLAEAAGYPRIAHFLLARACVRTHGSDPGWEADRLEPYGGLPFAVRAEVAELEESLAHARASLQAELAAIPPGEPWIRAPSCSLGPPLAATPSELPRGSDVEPIRGRFSTLRANGDWRDPSRLDPPPPGLVSPDDLVPVAVLRSGNDTLILALGSGDGPFQDDGYWIARSPDGGVSWELPHWTGLRVRGPFEVLAGSTRHRFEASRLVLEVGLASDGEAINLPELRAGGRALLTLPVAELLRDTDGDTLTDLEERSTHTDPEEADSDGDGTNDAFDPLPLGASPPWTDPDVLGAVAAVVERMLPSSRAPGPDDPETPRGASAVRRIPPLETHVLVGEGLPLEDLEVPGRVSVLARPPDGLQPAYEIQVFALDRDRDRAVVVWRQSPSDYSGGSYGTFLVARRDGRWRVTRGVHGGGCLVVQIFDD